MTDYIKFLEMERFEYGLRITKLERDLSISTKRIEFLLSPEGRHWIYWQMENEGTYTLEDIDKAAELSLLTSQPKGSPCQSAQTPQSQKSNNSKNN